MKLNNNTVDEFGVIKPLNTYANRLKRQATPAEVRFQEYLKRNHPEEIWNFQLIFGWYILDFTFTERNVAVELDGSSHNGREEQDSHRDEWLNKYGITVLRFNNKQVFDNPEVIVKVVKGYFSREPFHRCKMRAASARRVRQEKKLLERGMRHDYRNKLVPLDAPLTKRQSTIEQRLDKVVDVAFRVKGHQRPLCPLCSTKVGCDLIRCRGCSAIIRLGLVKPTNLVRNPPPKCVLKKREMKLERAKLRRMALNAPNPDLIEKKPDLTIEVSKGRVVLKGKRVRPRCSNCNTAVARTWERCKGCNALIVRK